MRKSLVLFAVLGVVACVGATAWSARDGKDGGDGDFSIYVAPSNIAKSAPCNWLTIHTDVAFAAVDGTAVAVDGQDVQVASAYADDCGNLVVKVKFADVTAIVAPPSATVTLTVAIGEEALSASETVGVKD